MSILQAHVENTFEALKTQFVDTGAISYAYIHSPLERIHKSAFAAAKVAECASDQGKFWDAHAGLFRAAASPGLNEESIAATVTALRLDEPGFDDCLNAVSNRIERDLKEARRLGVRSTPTFLVGVRAADGTVAIRSRINGAQPLDVFVSTINGVRKR